MLRCRALCYEWPNGHRIFSDLNFNFEGHRLGLIGPNGGGKSTLLRVLVGELLPSKGECRRSADLLYLPQVAERPDCPVWDYLGDLEQSDDIWRTLRLDQSCRTLSGGEWMKLRLLKAFSQKTSFLLLDEPTASLDESGREWFLQRLEAWGGGHLIASHDRGLLDRLSELLVLEEGHLRSFSGNWTDYQEAVQALARRTEEKVQAARQELRRVERQVRQNRERQNQRTARGKKSVVDSGLPRLLLGIRKRQAEETTGALDVRDQRRREEAADHLREQQKRLATSSRPFYRIRRPQDLRERTLLHLEGAQMRESKSEVPFWTSDLTFKLSGGERLWIRGENGSGKTSFIRFLQGQPPAGLEICGEVENRTLKWAYLDQEPAIENPDEEVWMWFRRRLSGTDLEIRNSLAQFQFPLYRLQQKMGELSGGERTRAFLASLLLAEDPPELLFLDEPTNHLDLVTCQWLEAVLRDFDGGLVVITHDADFAKSLNVDREIFLTRRTP